MTHKGPKRDENSTRSIGKTTVAVDVLTRNKLKELAGSMPVSHYLREIAFAPPKSDSGSPVPFFGQERLVSPNTIAAVKSDMAAIMALVKRLDAAFDKAVPPYDWNKDAIVQLARFIAKEAQQVAEVQPSMFNEKETA